MDAIKFNSGTTRNTQPRGLRSTTGTGNTQQNPNSLWGLNGTENSNQDRYEAGTSDWAPYKLFSNGRTPFNFLVSSTQSVEKDDPVTVDDIEFVVPMPENHDPKAVRDGILRRLGYSDADIRAYDQQYPTKDGDVRPENNGFYVRSDNKKEWATPEEVAGWTDGRGNAIVEVEGSSVNHLKSFLQERLGRTLDDLLTGVNDPARRRELKNDANLLLTSRGDERVSAYERLIGESDPAKIEQAKSLLKGLSENGYDKSAWLKLAQAGLAKEDPQQSQALLEQARALANGKNSGLSQAELKTFEQRAQTASSGKKEETSTTGTVAKLLSKLTSAALQLKEAAHKIRSVSKCPGLEHLAQLGEGLEHIVGGLLSIGEGNIAELGARLLALGKVTTKTAEEATTIVSKLGVKSLVKAGAKSLPIVGGLVSGAFTYLDAKDAKKAMDEGHPYRAMLLGAAALMNGAATMLQGVEALDLGAEVASLGVATPVAAPVGVGAEAVVGALALLCEVVVHASELADGPESEGKKNADSPRR